MLCSQFLAVVFLPLYSVVFSLSLNNNLPRTSVRSPLNSQNPNPDCKKVLLNFHVIDEKDCQVFDIEARKFLQEHAGGNSHFAALLKRCNGLNLYGRQIEHSETDTNCATLLFMDDSGDAMHHDMNTWDATLTLAPTISEDSPHISPGQKDKTCFVAMNRFDVKEDCKHLFEERWSERKSKLSFQPGFLGFSLLRKTQDDKAEGFARFNYSTLTLWDSLSSWDRWRNGEGRYSHDASRNTKRVPISEWLEGPSSPIFWEGEKVTEISSMIM